MKNRFRLFLEIAVALLLLAAPAVQAAGSSGFVGEWSDGSTRLTFSKSAKGATEIEVCPGHAVYTECFKAKAKAERPGRATFHTDDCAFSATLRMGKLRIRQGRNAMCVAHDFSLDGDYSRTQAAKK
jgi:hypothetical protein